MAKGNWKEGVVVLKKSVVHELFGKSINLGNLD